jgi:ABC-type sugar transport system ATPase subunit
LCVAFPGASVPLPPEVAAKVRGAGPDVVLGLRPESLSLAGEVGGGGGSGGSIGASVVIVELLGAETHVICTTETGTRIIVRQGAEAPKPKIGEAVRIAVSPDPRAYHLFDATTGERLGPS